MSFRKLVESPVGMVGRTGQMDALNHINNELKIKFFKIVKELGGKTVARELINTLKSDSNPLNKNGDDTLKIDESAQMKLELISKIGGLLGSADLSALKRIFKILEGSNEE